MNFVIIFNTSVLQKIKLCSNTNMKLCSNYNNNALFHLPMTYFCRYIYIYGLRLDLTTYITI